METLIQECQLVSNVSVLCKDGLVNTHKIVLAGISDFIKDILAEIPVGDQATLFMPNFKSEELEKFLSLSINTKSKNPKQNVDISRAFGISTPKQESNVKVEMEDENEFETFCFEGEEDDIMNEDMNIVLKESVEENGGSEEVSDNIVKLKITKSVERSAHSAGMLMSIQDFEEKIRALEENIIQSPRTARVRIKNNKIRTNINFQKALSDIIHKGL